MTSINTNLSSIILQNSLTNSTNGVNKAIERMTTGSKLNQAKDNASGYSIAGGMSTKLLSYDTAGTNIASGMDMLQTAQDTISLMQQHGARIHALITQARNGIYSGGSLDAVNAEVSTRIAEITKLYTGTTYNNINLLEYEIPLPDWAKEVQSTAGEGAGLTVDLTPKYDGFIQKAHNYDDATVNALTHVSELDAFVSGKTYAISTVDDLVRLAELVNDGNTGQNVTFRMGADIDLAEYCAEHIDDGGWTPIGSNGGSFAGTFDGNGHTISNLTIDREDGTYQGLFGNASKCLNLGLANVNIRAANCTGGLAGKLPNVDNCYVTGSITCTGSNIAGLVGVTGTYISNSYARVTVEGLDHVGGIAGEGNVKVSNCFSEGSISGQQNVGGILGAGYVHAQQMLNCYSTSDVNGRDYVGGLIGGHTKISTGEKGSQTIVNCYTTGNIVGTGNFVGGISGTAKTITNCYATGSVKGVSYVGGLSGRISNEVSNSYSTGDVKSSGNHVGGLIGNANGSILNSYSTGSVTATGSAKSYIGGLVGNYTGGSIKDSYTTSEVIGSQANQKFVGGIIGGITKTTGTLNIENVFTTGNLSSDSAVSGSFIGGVINTANGTDFADIKMSNLCLLKQGEGNLIGGAFSSARNNPAVNYDMSEWLENIYEAERQKTTFQVGINGNSSSQITIDTAFQFDLSPIMLNGVQSEGAYDAINNFLSVLNEKSTELGAASNKLESAMEAATIAMENLTSSISTIKDADIAKESSAYIRQQILQQASATLLATANQSPAIALQLI